MKLWWKPVIIIVIICLICLGLLCLRRTFLIADVLFCDHNNQKYILFGNLRTVRKVNEISKLILEWLLQIHIFGVSLWNLHNNVPYNFLNRTYKWIFNSSTLCLTCTGSLLISHTVSRKKGNIWGFNLAHFFIAWDIISA